MSLVNGSAIVWQMLWNQTEKTVTLTTDIKKAPIPKSGMPVALFISTQNQVYLAIDAYLFCGFRGTVSVGGDLLGSQMRTRNTGALLKALGSCHGIWR